MEDAVKRVSIDMQHHRKESSQARRQTPNNPTTLNPRTLNPKSTTRVQTPNHPTTLNPRTLNPKLYTPNPNLKP